jgi:lipopolysaccharide transport system permease protein
MRDIGQIVPIFLQLGFWFTPIVYTSNILPEHIARLLQLNPMYWVVQGIKMLFVQCATIVDSARCSCSNSGVLLGLSFVVFRRANTKLSMFYDATRF